MKILTAIRATQGQRASDFNCCIEGEVVTFVGVLCDTDRREDPDGGCGCGRAFAGLNSHKGTTTAVVRDIDGYTFEDLAAAGMQPRFRLRPRPWRSSPGWQRQLDPQGRA
jgi:hypothetical protein